jgi:RimJ/RimL family protein N-acetyltransferase
VAPVETLEGNVVIRALTSSDLEAYVRLRRESLLDAPLALSASPEDDFAATTDALLPQIARAPDWVIFGAFEDELVGALGAMRDRHLKAAHKVHVWGMYVTPAARGRGIARALLDAAIDHARSLPGVACVRLAVSSAAPEARRLYERAGFRPWGVEPDAVRHAGRTAEETYMDLPLEV